MVGAPLSDGPTEPGGPRIVFAPGYVGLGSPLARKFIGGHVGGTICHTWQRRGRRVRIGVPSENFVP